MKVRELKSKLVGVPDDHEVILSHKDEDGEITAYSAKFETGWEPSSVFELATDEVVME